MAQVKKKTTVRRRRERKNIEQGQVHILQTKEHRFSVIRISQNYFCMIKPDSYIPDEKKDKDSDAEKNAELK